MYFTTPHFAGYPAVLVRRAAIVPDELHDLLRDPWPARVPKRLSRACLQSHP